MSPVDERPSQTIRELPEITAATDTRDYLSHAAALARQHADYKLIIDVDAYLQEAQFFLEIIDLLENDVLKRTAQAMLKGVTMPLGNRSPRHRRGLNDASH